MSRISWGARRVNDACVEMKAVKMEIRPSDPPLRIHHPAVAAPAQKCFRVIRKVLVNGVTEIEDIGAFTGPRAFGNALFVSAREIGYAVILDPNGKELSYNGQPLQTRA